MTSLATCTWMCRLCGREACAECYEQVKELTLEKPNVNQAELAAIQARREKCVHINPFFLSCTRRNEHSAKDFSPVSRFFQEELDEAIPEMERLLGEEAGLSQELNSSGPTNGMPELSSSGLSSSGSSSAGVPTPPPDSNSLAPLLSGSSSHKQDISSILNHEPVAAPPYIPPHLPPITASIPSYEIRRYTYDEVSKWDSISVFAPIWQRGEPIVVTGCLERFKIEWTPQYFVEHYGDQTCLIIECQAGTNKRVTVSDFFDMFGKYEGRTDCWKLKDWPPSTDFKSVFPELYQDFSNAVPVPDYVRRDGVANVGSHFPSNTIAPDLGPKMYNALASNMGEGSKGTTRLHLDMADAVNIMTYTEKCPDGSSGCAAWDIFRSGDSDKLRTFLHQKFPKQATDPIHGQQIYLDEVCRKELYEQFGVKSYRIYQRPGEAIFIPAGCAHQVANLADCVKVAIDFVSVENIVRCEELTREFRELNQKLAWKEDVLQLRNMMWFAWQSCGMFEKGEPRSGSAEFGEGDNNGDEPGGGGGGGVKAKKKGTRGRKRATPSVGEIVVAPTS
jgi:lysine-specific demethylase 3